MKPTTWDQLKPGDCVWIDNYQDGKFPTANPKLSGPYRVMSLKYRQLRTLYKVPRNKEYRNHTFTYCLNGGLQASELGDVKLRDVRTRYYYLLRTMRWVACLSIGEAIACLDSHKRGDNYSSEAVNAFGGTRRVLQQAWEKRHYANASAY